MIVSLKKKQLTIFCAVDDILCCINGISDLYSAMEGRYGESFLDWTVKNEDIQHLLEYAD